MNQVTQLQDSIRQVKQNLDSINSQLNQVNQLFGQSFQQLNNSVRLSNQIQQQFTGSYQPGMQVSRPQYGQTTGMMGGSQYQGGQYQGNQNWSNKQYQTSQSTGATGNIGGAQAHSINRRDEDVSGSYYNMTGQSNLKPGSQYRGQVGTTGGFSQTGNFKGSTYSGGQQPLYY